MEHAEYIRTAANSDTAALLIHGIAGTPAQFRDLLPLVPEDWSVYNLLLPGHGGSVEDFAASSMALWREYVDQRMQEILACHKRVVIISHSMGALFAIQQAAAHPEAVSGIFLLQVPLRIHFPPSTITLTLRTALGCRDAAAMAMRNSTSLHLTPQLWRYIPWVPRFVELLRQIRRTRKLLPRVDTPCLVCLSQCDELVSLRSRGDLANIPAVQTVVLPHSGHYRYAPEDLPLLQRCLEDMLGQVASALPGSCDNPPKGG